MPFANIFSYHYSANGPVDLSLWIKSEGDIQSSKSRMIIISHFNGQWFRKRLRKYTLQKDDTGKFAVN